MINKESFEKFSQGLKLAAAGAYDLASLVTFDTTATNALRSAQEASTKGETEESRYLFECSQRHLHIMKSLPCVTPTKLPESKTNQRLKPQEKSDPSLIDALAVVQEEPSNNENVNNMNTVSQVSKVHPPAKPRELREIIRPEYRRRIP